MGVSVVKILYQKEVKYTELTLKAEKVTKWEVLQEEDENKITYPWKKLQKSSQLLKELTSMLAILLLVWKMSQLIELSGKITKLDENVWFCFHSKQNILTFLKSNKSLIMVCLWGLVST